jgi:hypothetical protein
MVCPNAVRGTGEGGDSPRIYSADCGIDWWRKAEAGIAGPVLYLGTL